MKRTTEGYGPAKRVKTQQKVYYPRKRQQKLLSTESKYFDVGISFSMPVSTQWVSTNALANDAPQVVQGDDIVNRNGRKISLYKVMFKGFIQSNPATATTAVPISPSCRVLLVRNITGANSGVVNGDLVMGLNGGVAASNAQALGLHQSVSSFGRFKIVDDVRASLQVSAAVNNASATTVSAVCQDVPLTLKYRPKQPISLEYAGTATASPVTNGFNIIAACDDVTYVPQVIGVLRFYFTDI